MTRGSWRPGRGEREASKKPALRGSANANAAPIDLGIALSVYGKTPRGELIALNEPGPAPAAHDAAPEFDTGSTEH